MTSKTDESTDNLGLTEDELAALAEETAEVAADATAAQAKIDAVDGKAEAKPDGKADEKPADGKADASADDAKAAADTEGKAEAKPEGAADAKDEPHRQAVPAWSAPADAAAKLKEIETTRDALAERFDNGEISAKDLLTEQRKLDRQERDIERQQDRAEMAREMTEAVWLQNTVPSFLEVNPHYRDNPTLHGMLDAEVRRQQVAASEAGKDPLAPSILAAADKAIRESLSALGTNLPAAGKAEGKAADVKPAPKLDAAGKPAIPPSLANIPAAEISGTDSKFATLDRLDPIELEAALTRMPESEREMYLARSH